MIDRERVLNLLALLDDYLIELEGSMGITLEEYKENIGVQRISERLLQLISKVELDISEEIYKGLELKFITEEQSLLHALDNVLGKSVVGKIVARRNMRNQLVHAYVSYNVEEVFSQASDLSDVKTFMNATKKLIK